MARQRLALAKVSRPRLYGVIARERLFGALDGLRRHPVVWVTGPPGAGKTTLVATYLEARKLDTLWYQIDAGDSDPASFFFYLSQAEATRAAHKRPPLPLLNPEYLRDLSGFTRRFFRELFSRLPAEAAVVLDNYQDVNIKSSFHEVVRDLLAEVPAGVNVIVVSRTDPPSQYSRALANNLIGRLEWEDLRLTFDETSAIVASSRDLDERALRSMQEQSNGWAAGLILLLERLNRTGALGQLDRAETMDTVFDYFAGQVFDHTPVATRHLLLRTAFLPSVTAAAAADLSGNPEAGEVLDGLYRRHLFTDRRISAEVSYQYHALFRRFLLARVREAFDEQERRQLQQRSATHLENSGDADGAFQLHVDAAAWSAATALILKESRSLIAQGRWRTLKAWIGRIPREHVEATPWLQLWVGSSLVLANPPEARRVLAGVYDQFLMAGDQLGQLLAATGSVESYNIECSAFSGLDRWVAALSDLLPAVPQLPSASIRLRAYTAMLLAAMFRQPGHPAMAECARRATAMLDDDISVTSKVDAATQLLQYFDFTADLDSAAAIVAKATPYLTSTGLSPLRSAGWLVFLSYHGLLSGASREGFDALDRAGAVADEYGLPWFRFFDSCFRALLHLMRMEASEAAQVLDKLVAMVGAGRPADSALSQLAHTMLYQVRHDSGRAAYHAGLCMDAVRETGSAFFDVLFRVVAASAFIEAGEHERARLLVQEARGRGGGSVFDRYEPLLLMAEAYSAWDRRERTESHLLLRRALDLARTTNSAYLFRWLVLGCPRMLGEALAAGIETAFVRSVIETYGISAPAPDVSEWPWAIKIYALGRFAIELDGTPLRFGRKVPKKPVELLQYLVAQGGVEVDVATLSDALWPDAEGGSAHDSFEVTLRRLRRLLGRDDAIALTGSRLSLDAKTCWVDAWALDHLQRRTDDLLRLANGESPPAAELEALSDGVLRIYRGHLLPANEEQPWALGYRQRLASAFQRHTASIGRYWEEHERWDTAVRLYQRSLELDPFAETFYRRLMIVQARLGHRSEALATYGRCQEMLLRVFSSKPSPETESVRRAVDSG